MKKLFAVLLAVSSIAFLTLFGCESGIVNNGYTPDSVEKTEGNDDFGDESNSFSADVTLDGYLTDSRWSEADVVSLGSWDDSDIESGVYGAIVKDFNDYANTKRAIVKMFRGNVGLHFGFEVKDDDLAYTSLENGDPAIFTDNVLLNLCTAIDGSTIPMSDDYYLLVTAFGNYCFRRGANAAGMWGAWSGILDYQAAIHTDADGNTVGFGVELVVPYVQIGMDKNDPIGVTFRSCDRVAELNAMLEREWYFNGDAHQFNCPNGYAIWGSDNKLYDYYDYKMPSVTVKGTVTDQITGEALGGVKIGENIVSAANGEFTIENVDSNEDLTLNISDDRLIATQSYVVGKDKMRAAKGGTVAVSVTLLTKANRLTQTIEGTITSVGSLENAYVEIGGARSNIEADGTFSVDCEFSSGVMTLNIYLKEGAPALKKEIYLSDAVKGKIVVEEELPVMTALPEKFGTDGKTETLLGWVEDGLFVRFTATTSPNGLGVAFSTDGESGKVVLYHSFGTMCVTDFVNQTWDYAAPGSFGSTADIHEDANGNVVFTFTVPYSHLGITAPSDIYIAPFEYSLAGPFVWYEDKNGTSYPFGVAEAIKGYPVMNEKAQVTFTVPEQILSAYTAELSGKSGAKISLKRVKGAVGGIRVEITYKPAAGLFGFGIMFGNLDTKVGITQLYAVGYGTIDHREYGNWLWNGNYQQPSALGVSATEVAGTDSTVITLFYSYETLCSANYSLGINDKSERLGVQFFEYVTDNSGNLYAVYNCVKNGDDILAFDSGVENFLEWSFSAKTVLAEYSYGALGEGISSVNVTVEKGGVRFKYVATETANTFGYGVCLQAKGGSAISVLYATTGNMAKMEYGQWAWIYELPSAHSIAASRTDGENGTKIIEFFLSNEVLGVTSVDELNICLFETVNGGGSQYGIYNCMQKDGTEIAIDGGVDKFVTIKKEG